MRCGCVLSIWLLKNNIYLLLVVIVQILNIFEPVVNFCIKWRLTRVRKIYQQNLSKIHLDLEQILPTVQVTIVITCQTLPRNVLIDEKWAMLIILHNNSLVFVSVNIIAVGLTTFFFVCVINWLKLIITRFCLFFPKKCLEFQF